MQWFDVKNKKGGGGGNLTCIRIAVKENLLNNEIKAIKKCPQNAFQALSFPTHFPKG